MGEWTRDYVYVLQRFFAQEIDFIKDSRSVSLGTLFPILHLGSFVLKRYTRTTLELLKWENHSRLYDSGKALRETLEDTEFAMAHLHRYTILQQSPKRLQDPVYQKLEEEKLHVNAQTRRLGAEVRDFIQLQSGLLAMEEAKKSIELSENQIQEGKRSKTEAKRCTMKLAETNSQDL